MTIDFKKLKERSKALKKDSKSVISGYGGVFKGNDYSDNTFWKPTISKSGNAMAKIRFLSNPQGDSNLNVVKFYDHFFQVPETNLYYVENSLTTFNITDPIGKYVKHLWKVDEESARRYKRKTNFVANVLVIDDPENPENNGKVFKYKFGVKIFDKIQGALMPEFADQKSVDIFDLWEGANFNVRMKKDGKFYSYESSGFDVQSTIGTDEEILKVLESSHDLSYIVNIDSEYQGKPFYKTIEQLQESMERAFGRNPLADFEDVDTSAPVQQKQKRTVAVKEEDEPVFDTDEDMPWDTDESEDSNDDDSNGDAFSAFLNSAQNK